MGGGLRVDDRLLSSAVIALYISVAMTQIRKHPLKIIDLFPGKSNNVSAPIKDQYLSFPNFKEPLVELYLF